MCDFEVVTTTVVYTCFEGRYGTSNTDFYFLKVGIENANTYLHRLEVGIELQLPKIPTYPGIFLFQYRMYRNTLVFFSSYTGAYLNTPVSPHAHTDSTDGWPVFPVAVKIPGTRGMGTIPSGRVQ